MLTNRVSRLTGTVQDGSGNPVIDRTVVAVPVNDTYWHPGNRHIRVTYPDATGRYDFVGLPAGGYLVAAVVGIHRADLYERAVFQEIAAAGTRTLIEAAGTTTLDVVVATGDSPVAK